ncbi:hypothetical protein, partial [Bradyrhizobium sp.]|uniref:hypothetical protein n=1 Tax=Bradyrhizobium sp. TaxID=376 RepID=UPI0025C246F5
MLSHDGSMGHAKALLLACDLRALSGSGRCPVGVKNGSRGLTAWLSVLPPGTDMELPLRHVRFVPIVLKKAFFAMTEN